MQNTDTPQSHIGTPDFKHKIAAGDVAPQYINPAGLFRGSYVPEWLEGIPTIPAGAKLCYARLCRYAGKNGFAWPHEKTLAAQLGGVTERTVRNYLRELKDAGLIHIRRQRIRGKPQNVYRFLLHPAMGLFPESESSNRNEASASNRKGSSGQNRKGSSGSSYKEESHKLRESTEGKVLPLFPHQHFSRRSVNEQRHSEPKGDDAIREFLRIPDDDDG